jgi:polyketide biosynthesis 3-hydroxy-3-methylglutaryl-CoA synthase-like enzyme PksG
MTVGIEAINLYGGSTFLDVHSLFEHRGLDLDRFDNLMMEKKSVGLPCEDPVTNAVNAAKPILDMLDPSEKDKIKLIITATESGIDFGKSLSTYVHDYLNLSRNCRLFEVKEACYGGTAAFQMAAGFVNSQVSQEAKALVIATDAGHNSKGSYAEPTQAVGAVALLVSSQPKIFELDWGAAGYYSYEVMDTCRPEPGLEIGDPDLSLYSYLDCLENSYKNYVNKVKEVNFLDTFDYLAFHTPFAGMVKGAHRKMVRQFTNIDSDQRIEEDFQKRVAPSLEYCTQIGNIYSATLYAALCGIIDNAEINHFKRIGMFSYGSGCSSEFYSALLSPEAEKIVKKMKINEQLDRRYKLDVNEYDQLLNINQEWTFGIKNKETDISSYAKIYKHFFQDRELLVLKRINDYHREYGWS